MMTRFIPFTLACLATFATPGLPLLAQDFVWWEGEEAIETNFSQDSWFRPQNDTEREKLSGSAWLDHEGVHTDDKFFARYQVEVPKTASYQFWTRKFWKHGPFLWRFDGGKWSSCFRDRGLADSTYLRRHVSANWVHLGEVDLEAGPHTFELRLFAKKEEKVIACFDAFLLTTVPFQPRGKLRPAEKSGQSDEGWWPFEPPLDRFEESPLDLRHLNEKEAGESGFVDRKKDGFVLGNGKPIRFWGVNAGPEILDLDPASIEYLARKLAKLGVNMVRVHTPVLDRTAPDPGSVDPERLASIHRAVSAFKKEGIYTMISFFFPFWFDVQPSWKIPGYAKLERRTPFALIFFETKLQTLYRSWARALLTGTNPHTDLPLARDPAVALVELVNEDSLFSWTFRAKNIPEVHRATLEVEFASWVRKRHRSIERALATWGAGSRQEGDRLGEGRLQLLDASHMTDKGAGQGGKRLRMSSQVRFLAERQRTFYESTIRFLRDELGMKNLVSCGNWKTVDPRLLGPLERWTYTAGDVLDRHGYFEGPHEGPAASYQLNPGDTYSDRAGVLEPAKLPLRFAQVAGFPQITSEIGWPNPNRFRAEFPFLSTAYGSLQGVDGLLFFSLGSAFWESSARKFPLSVPSILGQFPAAALAYRRGDIQTARPVIQETLPLRSLFALEGSAAVTSRNLDALRKIRIPRGGEGRVRRLPGVDPLAFYVGPVLQQFTKKPASSRLRDLAKPIDREAKIIRSLTGELLWDYGRGIVTIDTPRCQGATGFLSQEENIKLSDVMIESRNEFASLFVIALDDRPIARSKRILIQAVTEDRPYGWEVEDGKIVSLGGYPMGVRRIEISVTLKKSSRKRTLQTLDAGGHPRGSATPLPATGRIDLPPDALYTVVE